MWQIKYEKIKVNGIYMGVAFADSMGTTKDPYLMKRHKAKGATIADIPKQSQSLFGSELK